jgi:putative DNA-invertase from lambdoid prophage Rac
MTTFLYARVSSKAQADDGESLEVQQRKLQEYAKRKKLKDVKMFVDAGVSAFKRVASKRTEFKKILDSAKSGDVVVASKLDRVFRSVSDAAMTMAALKRKEVELHLLDKDGSVSGSINDVLSFNVLTAVAQWDSEQKGERIREIKEKQKADFEYSGGRREKGFRRVRGKLMVNESEKKILEFCVEWMKKRKAEGKQRSNRYSAQALRIQLTRQDDLLLAKSLYKKTYSVKDKRELKKQKKDYGELVKTMQQFGIATLYRLIDEKDENNAVVRLERIKQLERIRAAPG